MLFSYNHTDRNLLNRYKDFYMKSTIKNIYTFFLCALCLNISVYAGEWNLPVPTFQEVAEESNDYFTKLISDSLKDHPTAVVAVPVVMIFGAGLFAVRGKIHSFFEKKHQEGLDTLREEVQAQQDVFKKNPKFVLGMSFLGPICRGFPSYFAHNKYHLVGAATASCLGKFLGQATLGNFWSGILIAWGYFNQGFRQFQAENEAMHVETQKKIDDVKCEVGKVNTAVDEVKAQVTHLSKQLIQTDKSIKEELNKVGTLVTGKIDGVDKRITGLSDQLKDVPDQILDLITKVDQLGKNEENRVVEVRELISTVQNQYVEVKDGFSKMEQQVVAKLTTIESTVNAQNEKLDSQDQKINSILETTTKTGQLVAQLQDRQQEDHKKLLGSITANNSNSEQKLAFLGQLIESWEKNAVDFTKAVKSYESKQTENVQKIDTLFCRMDGVAASITSIDNKVDSQASELATIKQLMETSNKKNEELAKELKDLREEIKKRDKNFFNKLAETAGELKNQLGGKIDRLATQVTKFGAAVTGGYLSPTSVPVSTEQSSEEQFGRLHLALFSPQKQGRMSKNNEANS
jgi:chromosome segregation ATPase